MEDASRTTGAASAPVDRAALTRWHRAVEAYLAPLRPELIRPARGGLRHRFLDPCSVYTGQLWDWDSYFTALALAPYLDVVPVARSCVANFVDHQRADGSIPFRIAEDSRPEPDGRRPAGSVLNSAKPVLAQLALLGAGRDDADRWVPAVLPALARHVAHWERTQQHANGLFRWRSHRGSGADNHPAVYGRPLNATAGIDLNCLFVAEYRALAQLAERAGDEAAPRFTERAEWLAERVRTLLWDPVAEDFCSADVQTSTPDGVTQPAEWPVPLRFRSWTGCYALWSGVAAPEQASALVRRVLGDSDLLCDYGLRTLSAREPLFTLEPTANPSNWRGPVWVMSNYIAFAGLLRYGYVEEAGRIMAGTLRLLAEDLERTGALHEFYHPDTGLGLINPGFLNWNLLATRMVHDYPALDGTAPSP